MDTSGQSQVSYLNMAINRANNDINNSKNDGINTNLQTCFPSDSTSLSYRKRKYKQRSSGKHSSPNDSIELNELTEQQLNAVSDNEFSDEDDGRNSIASADGTGGRRSNSPLNDELRRNRQHHNELERKRRDHIKVHFNMLKNAIPLLEGEKSSRALILKRAADYIKMLQSEIKDAKQEIEKLKHHNDVLSQATSLLSSSQQMYGAAAAAAAANAPNTESANNAVVAGSIPLSVSSTHTSLLNKNGEVTAFSLPVGSAINTSSAFSSSPIVPKSLQFSSSLPQSSVFPSTSTSPTASIESSPTFSPTVACAPLSILSATDFKNAELSKNNITNNYRGSVDALPIPTITSPKNSTTAAPNVAELLSLLISQSAQKQQQQQLPSHPQYLPSAQQRQQPILSPDQQHFQHQLQISKDLIELNKQQFALHNQQIQQQRQLSPQQPQHPYLNIISTVSPFSANSNSNVITLCNNKDGGYVVNGVFNATTPNVIANNSNSNSSSIAIAANGWTERKLSPITAPISKLTL